MNGWIRGDVSGAQTLLGSDHLFASHINQLRESNLASAVVAQTANAQYYGSTVSVINRAIEDVSDAGGGLVWTRNGIYTTDEQLLLRDNVLVMAESWRTILYAVNGFNQDIVVNEDQTNGNSNFGLVGFKIDGNKTNQSSDSSGVYVAGGSSDCENMLFRDLWITNTSSMGLHPVRCTDIRVDGLYCTDVGTNTLHHAFYSIDNTNLLIERCLAKDGTGNGFNAKQGSKITLLNCIAASNAGSGIRIADYTYATVAGNTLESNASHGIDFHLEIAGGVTAGAITGNTCLNNRAVGVLASNSANITIAGNTSNENKNSGIEAHNSDRVTISGNTCVGNSNGASNLFSGILVGGNSSAVNVSGNTAIKSTTQQKYGLEIADTADSVHFSGNNFESNQTDAVNISTTGTNITYGLNKGY